MGNLGIGLYYDIHLLAKHGLSGKLLEDLRRHPERLNERNKDLSTPLHEACFGCHVDVVKALLDLGADTNLADASGQTALHVSAMRGRDDILLLLLDGGADVTVESRARDTALHSALKARHYDAAKLLVEYGSDIYAQNSVSVDTRSLHCIVFDPIPARYTILLTIAVSLAQCEDTPVTFLERSPDALNEILEVSDESYLTACATLHCNLHCNHEMIAHSLLYTMIYLS